MAGGTWTVLCFYRAVPGGFPSVGNQGGLCSAFTLQIS